MAGEARRSAGPAEHLPPESGPPTPEAPEREHRLPAKPHHWVILMVMAAIVGAGAGLVGALFRLVLAYADEARNFLIHFLHQHGPVWLNWLAPAALCAAGVALACWLTQRFAPHAAGSGVPKVEAAMRRHQKPETAHILPVKFVGGALGIGCGLALGREGPTVQMGATVGSLSNPIVRRILPEPWTLIAAGAGAGLAVAFNAPLAATLFVMEELIQRFSARIFSATLVSCTTGTIVLRAILGNVQDFGAPRLAPLRAVVLPEYLLLGLAAGLLGVAFNNGLLLALRWFDRVPPRLVWTRGAAIGAAAGLLAWFVPSAVGGGEALAQNAVLHPFLPAGLVALLAARYLLTVVSYSAGSPGGIFAPLLAMGALLGNGFASFWHFVAGPAAVEEPAAYAIVAMAACFTAIVRSPLTGVILLLEMTGGWTLILPMMAASVTAYAVPELMRCPPVYDSLRERDEALDRAARAAARPAAP